MFGSVSLWFLATLAGLGVLVFCGVTNGLRDVWWDLIFVLKKFRKQLEPDQREEEGRMKETFSLFLLLSFLATLFYPFLIPLELFKGEGSLFMVQAIWFTCVFFNTIFLCLFIRRPLETYINNLRSDMALLRSHYDTESSKNEELQFQTVMKHIEVTDEIYGKGEWMMTEIPKSIFSSENPFFSPEQLESRLNTLGYKIMEGDSPEDVYIVMK